MRCSKVHGPSYLDPSLALSFYCRDRDDFLDLCDNAKQLSSSGQNPIFCIIDAQLSRFDEAGERDIKHNIKHRGEVESDVDWELI